ncbi:guanylate kinase [Pyrinomonas methylaliphatogenes]|jgi:guanylate kinase|uniref:Guanylate kinase n=2 Tax=Pyrinomonas methylaliphatogenes TaxID=454194 RepID=A0A0B6WYQ5_9BACT|nr:guanylate kinase [Pyrinomonas methylaliphatogenes]
MLIVVSSPSGGGKGTLIQRVRRTVPGLSYSVSWTTRQPRPGEVEGRDYHFVSREEFERMRDSGGFLEWALVHGNYYGTAWSEVERAQRAGLDVILEIDVQGAANVRRLASDAVTIFILPPSFEVLRERLTRRGSEALPDLELRLRNARSEVERYREFEYIILNDDVERAAQQLAAVIYAERARRQRQEAIVTRVLATFPPNAQEAF